jgi:predicted flap endonuclease-1-like 5' DNA nuclease
MDHTVLIAIIVVVVVIGVFLVLRGRGSTLPEHEGHGIADEAAHAIEDIAGPLLGVDAHPPQWQAPEADPRAPEDRLTMLKGLGPKAAAQLNSLGISSFAQLAALDEVQIAALDEQMGTFKGRVARDQWVEQAKLLAAGDRDGFEAKYGKLGSAA